MTLVDDDVVILCESNSVDIVDIVNINKRVCLNRCGCDGILLIVLSLGHFFIAITAIHFTREKEEGIEQVIISPWVQYLKVPT